MTRTTYLHVRPRQPGRGKNAGRNLERLARFPCVASSSISETDSVVRLKDARSWLSWFDEPGYDDSNNGFRFLRHSLFWAAVWQHSRIHRKREMVC